MSLNEGLVLTAGWAFLAVVVAVVYGPALI